MNLKNFYTDCITIYHRKGDACTRHVVESCLVRMGYRRKVETSGRVNYTYETSIIIPYELDDCIISVGDCVSLGECNHALEDDNNSMQIIHIEDNSNSPWLKHRKLVLA